MEDEPVIRIAFERNMAMDPAATEGANVAWTMESLIADEWMLVIGFATDQGRARTQQCIQRSNASWPSYYHQLLTPDF